VHRHTADRIYTHIRKRIIAFCKKEAPLGYGEHEVDESYFGGHRKGMRGRGAAGKVFVFGILKRNGKVYTTPVPDVQGKTLRAIIKQRVSSGSIIYTDSFGGYHGLITDDHKHHRINHQIEFVRVRRKYINGIENFSGFEKTKLRRHYGINRGHFFLSLKEMEFRFNNRNENILVLIRKILKSRTPF